MTARTRTLVAALFLAPALTWGQAGGFLTVHSGTKGLAVYVDSALIGRTPVDSVLVAFGTAVLRVLPPEERSWTGPVLIETLRVHPGEHIVREVTPLRIGSITSEPYGARVLLGDSLVGSTPLLLPLGAAGSIVTVSRDGYESVSLPFTGDLHVVLAPRAGAAVPALAGPPSVNMTPVVVATGITVLAGTTAAYFKIKADQRYADYRQSGSASDLDAVHRLDLVSGISLGVSELSLFILAYELLGR